MTLLPLYPLGSVELNSISIYLAKEGMQIASATVVHLQQSRISPNFEGSPSTITKYKRFAVSRFNVLAASFHLHNIKSSRFQVEQKDLPSLRSRTRNNSYKK